MLVYHPQSQYSELMLADRKEEVEKNYLLKSNRKNKFNWDTYKDEINTIQNLVLSKAERILKRWERQLEERAEYLDTIKYSTETPIEQIELKEKLMKETSKLWDQYQKCLKTVENEQSKTLGDMQESILDQISQ